jgi:hypothetical protein
MTVLRLPPARVPPSADEQAQQETERKNKLFAWADDVLTNLGLVDRIKQANTLDELRKIVFDGNAADVILAIREALHPASGQKKDKCFAGLNEGGLGRILKKRFAEKKEDRETELRRGQSAGGAPQPNWTDDLILGDEGQILPVLANLKLFLTRHPAWEGVLAYDEFALRVVIRKQPPWGEEPPDSPWSDHHESLTRIWFQHEDIRPGTGDVTRAVQAAARVNKIHAVREYFGRLKWDGVPRLDTFLPTYFRADNNKYTQAVGRKFLISMVARIYDPGHKVDHMLVLEGSQGTFKSSGWDALAAPWFADRLSAVGSKDVCIEIAGVLLIEVAEMDAITKASASAAKGFLARRSDRYRPVWGKHAIDQPRQCAFVGTINPPVGGYLKDPTGARRFWPVACHGKADRDGIKRDRDQIWAEAVARYNKGEVCWLETPELEALAEAEQQARFVVDVWTDRVEEWLDGRNDVGPKDVGVSIQEVIKGALKLDPENPSTVMRVAKILTSLGFVRVRPSGKGGKPRTRRYRRESSTE